MFKIVLMSSVLVFISGCTSIKSIYRPSDVKQKQVVVEDPTPVIDLANSEPEKNSVYAKGRKNLNLHYSPKLFKFWINYFTKRDKARFQRHLNNAFKYKSLISKILKEENVPEDLFFVALIESGLHSSIRSRASAVGPWQFMKGTGKHYGLIVNSSVDERRSFIKATRAAAHYLKDLHNIFGNWELSLCAYNAGEYRIINAIRRGNSRNYRELVRMKLLPKETVYYIPKVAAARELFNNYSKYKFKKNYPKSMPKLNLASLKMGKSFDVKHFSEIANIPYSKILSVNPDIKDRWVKLSRKQKFTVYLPKGTLITNVMKKSQYKVARAPKVKKTKSKVRHSRKTFKHKVASGQNLYMIAKKYKTTVARLKRTNRLRSSKLHVGQKLKVPNVVSKVYVVKKGDNLSIIAEKFNTSIGKIVMANSLKSKRIFPKQKIEVPIKIGQI